MYVIAKTIDGCLKVGWKIGRTGWVGGRRSERTIQKSGAGNWGSRSEKGNSAMAWRTDFVMGVTDVTGTGGSRVPPPRLEAKSGRSYRTAPSSRALWLSELCVAHAHRRKMKNETRRSVRSREFLGGIRWLILIDRRDRQEMFIYHCYPTGVDTVLKFNNLLGRHVSVESGESQVWKKISIFGRNEWGNTSKHVSRNHPGCEVAFFSFSFRVSFVRMASLVSSLTMSNELDERPGTISMEAGLSGEIQKGRGAEKNGEEMKNREWKE